MSAFLFAWRNQVLPKGAIEISSLTVAIILFMQKYLSKKKKFFFVYNSINYSVYHKRQNFKKSTTLHAALQVLCSTVYIVKILFPLFMVKKNSASSQKCIPEKLIFGHFEVIFHNILISPRVGMAISC